MNRTCEIHDTILQDDLKLRERPLKVLAAVDSFKGSMTSVQAGMAVKKGLEKNYKNCEIEVVPVADGGEGTMDAIAYGKSNMKRHTVNVTGPLGQVVKASYISYDEAGEKVALIEMAEAAGLPLVPESARNPMHTTTYGVGEMIKDAMLHGCRSFIIGIGGSATNDAGIGMLQALGCHFLDEHGNEVCYGAEGLSKVCGIHTEDMLQELSVCSFQIACDVTNPLVGENGCSHIFAPQKGADAQMVENMEKSMVRYADLVEQQNWSGCKQDKVQMNTDPEKCQMDSIINRMTPGAGAAGGLGYAFLMFLHARLRPGIDIVFDEIYLKERIKNVDLVITGEGRMDAQTLMGKTPAGVAKLAKAQKKKVVAFAGCFGEGIEQCMESGLFDACYSITDGLSEEERGRAMQTECAMQNMERAVREKL
jgi:glycerate kinase